MRALLFYPPQLCLEEAVRIWSFSHLSNFPLAAFRLATHLRRRGYDIDFIDALNVYDNSEAAIDGALSEDRIDRHAPCGNFAEEKRTKPVYRVGLDPEQLEARLAELSPPDEIYVSSIFTWRVRRSCWARNWRFFEWCACDANRKLALCHGLSSA